MVFSIMQGRNLRNSRLLFSSVAAGVCIIPPEFCTPLLIGYSLAFHSGWSETHLLLSVLSAKGSVSFRAVSIICRRLHVPGSNLRVACSFLIFLVTYRRVSHLSSPPSVSMFINGKLSFDCATVFCYRVDSTL
jgi:hypothetical protein